MLDLHLHLIPAVDDGAPDLQASLEMARALVNAGFTQVAPSPHVGGGPGGDVPPEIAGPARDTLRAAFADAGLGLEILPNGEHLVCPELFERIPQGLTPIGGAGRWLLVELPWDAIAQPEAVLFRLQTKGYRLLLAHPERYGYLDVDTVERLCDRGVRMQLELGSFIDVYGGRAAERAEALVSRGCAHVLATDLHRPRQAEQWLERALRSVKTMYGADALTLLLRDNPRALVNDAAPEAIQAL